MTRFLTAITLAAFTATATHAGGPVIIEDATEAAPQRHDWLVPVLLIGAIAILASGGKTCFQDETPEPTQPGC